MVTIGTNNQKEFGDRQLVEIRVNGDDLCTVRGYLNVHEQEVLADRCKAAGVSCFIEPQAYPVGYNEVLSEPDTQRGQDILSILQRREDSNG